MAVMDTEGVNCKRSAGQKTRSPRWINLKCSHESTVGRPSSRTAAIGMHYGIPLFGKKQIIVGDLRIPIEAGKMVVIVGPSGSGKTSILNRIESLFAGGNMVQRIRFPNESAIIDQIAPWASLSEALSIATCCGFSQAHLWVRPFNQLSDGEKFRAQLARAVALHVRSGRAAPLMCDEFCSVLHRRVAKSISYNLQKLIKRRGLTAILAIRDEDLINDLQPDVLVRLTGNGYGHVTFPESKKNCVFSLRRRLRIEKGRKKDYEIFSDMHYRTTEELGFVDKVFVLRDGGGGDPLGIVVYAHGPLELSLRNQATGGRFVRNPRRVNRSFRILRRLVIHPDIRGCGLGHYFVRKTLPMVGKEYVECLAAMGEINPVFEKAGMQRIGQYDISKKRKIALNALKDLDVDPFGRDFPMQVSRRRRIREIVAGVVYDWYSATTAGGECRVDRQTPQFLAQTFRGLIGTRPVYYLWRRTKPINRK